MVSLKCLFLANIIFLIGFSDCTDELIALVQLFRHGQRTPTSFYKNDPYADLNKYFDGLGFGQLTNEGKRQHYALGQLTRTRYSSFIPPNYNHSYIAAQTTDVDRTHMSAQANLFGLFPANGSEMWKENITWQPIPVHPANPEILLGLTMSCLSYTEMYKEVFKSEEYVVIDETYADLYKYLSIHSGENVTSLMQTSTIYDCLKIENDLGYTLPSWASSIYPNPLRNLAGWAFKSYTYSTSMKRLSTGPFLNEVLTYFENMAENPSYSQKIQMYSAHDSNIAAVLNCFGAFDPPYPPEFASTIWMELHMKDWVHVLNVYSKDGNKTTQISIKNCNMDCPLSEIRELLSDILVDVNTRNKECEVQCPHKKK